MPRYHCCLAAEVIATSAQHSQALYYTWGVSSTNSPFLSLEEEESVECRREPAERAGEPRAPQDKAVVCVQRRKTRNLIMGTLLSSSRKAAGL